MRFAAPAFAALWSVLAADVAEARSRTYLIVIGVNRSLDEGVAPLQYADDDAAKNFELFSLYADRAALFSIFDLDTARLHAQAAERAEVPERAAILERLARFNREMERDLERGDEPELFVLYAGHGDVDDKGEGYVTFHDQKLTRSALYREIIAPSKARFVHVVVDACKSYYLVQARSGAWRDDTVETDRSDEAVNALLVEESLDRHPRAGVIVATSGSQETHEWSRFRGGILSHELRSALSGAADVNGDRRIEYSEVRAFLAAANARVKNPQVKLQTFSRPPPIDRHRPLVDLTRLPSSSGGRLLRFTPSMSGHFSIEDERGVRYADVNKDRGTTFDLLVPAARGYWVRRDEVEEVEIEPSAQGDRIDLGDRRWSRISVASRGALEETFRRDLYGVPYGRPFYDGFVATSGDLAVADSEIAEELVADDISRPRHRLGLAYMISPAPIGSAGASHAAELRWAYATKGLASFGLAAELGYGSGSASLARPQDLTRVAILATIGFELPLFTQLALVIDAGIGWQMLSGTVELGATRLEGTEGKSLRGELSGGFAWYVSEGFAFVARGGLALEGLYSDVGTASALHPLASFGVVLEP